MGRYTSVIMWPGNERKEKNKQKMHQHLEGFDTWGSAEQIRHCPVTHVAVPTIFRVIRAPKTWVHLRQMIPNRGRNPHLGLTF